MPKFNTETIITTPDGVERNVLLPGLLPSTNDIEYSLLDDKVIITWNVPVLGYKNIVQKKTMAIPKQLILDIYNKYIKPTEEGNRDET